MKQNVYDRITFVERIVQMYKVSTKEDESAPPPTPTILKQFFAKAVKWESSTTAFNQYFNIWKLLQPTQAADGTLVGEPLHQNWVYVRLHEQLTSPQADSNTLKWANLKVLSFFQSAWSKANDALLKQFDQAQAKAHRLSGE